MLVKKRIFSWLLLVVSLVSAGYFVEAKAQRCNLTLYLDGNAGKVAMASPTSILINQKTDTVYKARFIRGNPFFAQLPKGDYLFTVKKPGFETLMGSLTLRCGVGEEKNVHATLTICLGNPSDTYNVGRVSVRGPNSFTVKGDTESYCKGRHPVYTASEEPLRRRNLGQPQRTVSGGVLNGKAISFPKPPYPPAARAIQASGAVSVQVLVDVEGTVISANAVSGHPLLRPAAVAAARGAKFSLTLVDGVPVKVSGVITYNFIP